MIDFEIKATQLLLFVDTVDTKRHLQAKQCKMQIPKMEYFSRLRFSST